MKNVWVPIAAVFMIVGAVFLIQLKFESAFVVAVLGAVAWFLNYRGQVKTRLRGRYNDQNTDYGSLNDPDFDYVPNKDEDSHDSRS